MNTRTLINAARKRGLTQTQIARRAKTTQPTVARLMAGDYKFESKVKAQVDAFLTAWLHIVEFSGQVYFLRGVK